MDRNRKMLWKSGVVLHRLHYGTLNHETDISVGKDLGTN